MTGTCSITRVGDCNLGVVFAFVLFTRAGTLVTPWHCLWSGGPGGYFPEIEKMIAVPSKGVIGAFATSEIEKEFSGTYRLGLFPKSMTPFTPYEP